MKKALAILLVSCLLLTITACAEKKQDGAILGGLLSGEEDRRPEATIEVPRHTDAAEASDATTEATEAPMDYNALYAYLKDDYVALIEYRFGGSFQISNACDFPGISDVLKNALASSEEMADKWADMAYELSNVSDAEDPAYYAYILHDLNADDIPEMFWVRNDHSIVAVFTCLDGEVLPVDAYWSRYRGYVAWDGSLYTWGSSGAASNRCSSLTLNADGTVTDAFGFYTESQGDDVKYYEYNGEKVSSIAPDRYKELTQMHPNSQSTYWQDYALEALPGVREVLPPAEPETEPETRPTSQVPYYITIPSGSCPIYGGPGYDYSKVGTVQLAGVYTIVEEFWDSKGNLWGKLRSGAGWVDITDMGEDTYVGVQVSGEYATASLISGGYYHYAPVSYGQYVNEVVLRVNATVTNVSIFEYNVSIGYAEGPALYTLTQWDYNMPILADLAFPGDLTTFGLRFTDSGGVTHTYSISMSGYDGSIVVNEL